MGSKDGLPKTWIQTGFIAQRKMLSLAALQSPHLRRASGFYWDLGGREGASKEGGRVGSKYWQMREVKSRNAGGEVWTGEEGPSRAFTKRTGEKGSHTASTTATGELNLWV